MSTYYETRITGPTGGVCKRCGVGAGLSIFKVHSGGQKTKLDTYYHAARKLKRHFCPTCYKETHK